MSKQVENIKAGLSPNDNVESMKSQGSAFMRCFILRPRVKLEGKGRASRNPDASPQCSFIIASIFPSSTLPFPQASPLALPSHSSQTLPNPALGRRDRSSSANIPQGVDKTMNGSKAYGAARAKYLARNPLGGASVVLYNPDNYVYYTLSQYMMKTFNVPYPSKPPTSWKTASTFDGAVDSIDQDSDLVEVKDGG